MGKYRAVLWTLVVAVMFLFAVSGCTTAPVSVKPPAAAEETDWRSKYDYVGPFSEGRAWVKKDGQEFHVDRNGKPIYDARYDWVGWFSEGRALVMKDGKWWHILPNGEAAYPARYDWVGSFSEGLAWVVKDGEECHIDRNGKRIEE